MINWTKEQLDAINKTGTNIIVSAGAGSGKTAVLTERVINRIKNGTHINELLILTFTRNAADEMKYRIRKSLSSYKNELNLLNSSYITTFDSYALSILKKYHYLLNISKDIEVTDESFLSAEETRIFNEVFDSFYLKNNDNFNKLLDKYCIKNDKDLRKNIMIISKNIGSMFEYNNYISFIRNEFFSDENIDNLLNEYKSLLESKRNVIREEYENIKNVLPSNYINQIDEGISNILNIEIDKLYLISEVSFGRLTGASEYEKKLRDDFRRLVENLLSYSEYGSFKDIKNEIILSKDNINMILDITEEYLSKLKEFKKDNNIYTFNDIVSLSSKILKENDSIREEVKNSFKEIMIDEYQDTNDIQDMFINLISNNNVYMVGDIKQSIYRFRGSNPSLFQEKYDLYSKNKGGIKIDLLENFRSREDIIKSINNIFKLIMDSDIGGANYKASHQMEYGNKDVYDNNSYDENYYLDILHYDKSEEYSNSEIEIFTIAKDIREKVSNSYQVYDKELGKMRSVRYSDFSIILDRSAYFDDFKKVFEYESIPLTVLRDENITNNTDIYLIKNIIDFVIRINSNDFDVSFKFDFMSIARSFLYEMNDQDIFDSISEDKIQETALYKDLSNIKITNSKTCFDILKEVIDTTDFYNKLNKIGNYNDANERIKAIYNITKNYSNLGYDIYEFNDSLDNILNSEIKIKYSNNLEQDDAVKILTIHGSKGLEYPICYYADLSHRFNIDELKKKIIVSNKYGIIISNEDNEESVLKKLYKEYEKKEIISERLRLFYVALTRAKEKMIIVIPDKDIEDFSKDDNGLISKTERLKYNSLADFIYSIRNSYSKYFKKVDLDSLELTKEYLYNRNNLDDLKDHIDDIDVEEINIENKVIESKHFSKSQYGFINKDLENKIKYGTKIHEVLEYIDFKNYNPDLIEDEYIKDKVTKFIKSLNNLEDAKIYKEYEFNYKDSNNKYNGVIDLMLEYNDYIDIVDYKLKNIDDEAYKNQLLGYKKYIEMISSKKVNVYLYSIIDETLKKIEE